MSLLRPVLVIGSAVSCWVTFTAPAQAAKTERPKHTPNEFAMAVLLKMVAIPKIASVVLATLETVSTLSFFISDSQVPLFIRSIRGPGLPGSPSPLFITASALCMAGGVIRILCYRALGKLFTFNLSVREKHSLVTTGPYAWVRHPSYSGACLSANIAIILHLFRESWLQTSGLYSLPVVKAAMWLWIAQTFLTDAAIFPRMAEEDRMMKRVFEKDWDEWAAKVKYWIIPGLF